MSRRGGICCSQPGQTNSPVDNTDDVLLVGLEGSGKTLLGMRLRTVFARAPAPVRCATTATNGCQEFRVPTHKSCAVREVTLRECGGSMRALWTTWYGRPLAGVVFALDASDAASLAGAAAALYELLQHPALLSTPVALALTKTDLPVTLSRAELDLALGLADLERLYPGRLWVVSLSSVRTHDDCPAQEALARWLGEAVARRAAAAAARRQQAAAAAGGHGGPA